MRIWGIPALLAFLAPLPLVAAESFGLRQDGQLVHFVVGQAEAGPIKRAAQDLAADILSVVGERPAIRSARPGDGHPLIVVGQVGAGGAIDALSAAGHLDLRELEGAWESFVIEEIAERRAGEGRLLVVAGSDVRGTIFGIYELSRAIGVSPWSWWADVPVERNPAAAIPAARQRFGPPSVKYRGVFLNDEDWGLHPWAGKTFDPELGDIGPKTYAKVFELLLRLRANCLWPAMHKVSRPFNADGKNAALAEAYGIVMSSSHAEPMLRSNVREWTDPPESYNFRTHRDAVLAYWEERLETNGGYENIYTIGMRGIHDSGMQGGATLDEQVTLLESIFSEQRDLLRKHVDPAVETIPQIFVAYKEVLELYRAGLKVPTDVTIVWPDDNHGFIRDFATAEEQAERAGGFGVYYHISYLGRPMAYLWLNSIPPALMWEELAKAYAHGANRFWMLNVGDLKPAELGIDFFFRLAWKVEEWGPDAQPKFLQAWSRENFGPDSADEIAAVMAAYFRLNFSRKPEHLQFYLPLQEPRLSNWSETEISDRLAAYSNLVTRVEAIGRRLSPKFADAFFQLISYPVKGSAAANRRYFHTERFRKAPSVVASREAWAAEAELRELTRFYNEDLAEGKWKHFMALEPADPNWRSMRIASLSLPPREEDLNGVPERTQEEPVSTTGRWPVIEVPLEGRRDTPDAAWTVVPGLGRSGKATTVLPFAQPNQDSGARPALVYEVEIPEDRVYEIRIEVLPTFPLGVDQPLRLGLTIDGRAREILALEREVKTPAWSEGVLAGHLTFRIERKLSAGSHRIQVDAPDRGVVVDRLVLQGLP